MSNSINNDFEQIGPAYIAGPTATSGTRANATDGKRKVVFLFGWVEGQFKHLAKYAQVYRSKGYTTIVQLSTTADYNLCHGNQDLKSQDFDSLIAYIKEHSLVEPHKDDNNIISNNNASGNDKIVIHCFSNGGVFKLRRFITSLHAQNLTLKSTHVILDSCPGRPSALSGAGFLTSGITNPYLKSIVWTLSYAGLVPFLTLFGTSNHAISRSASYAVSTKNKDGNVHGPRLFLYSDSDDLVQASEVRGYIQEAKKEGVVVEERFFVGSPHVMHAVVFKEEYWNTVDRFLGLGMKPNNKNQCKL
ncbi:hypothetical protein BDR26DRAFT_1008890 [Obelidium mucronatum]|nr:hypothetical protein BDR26DRAFT_1008890 [Obelidium mucronatum]